MTGDIDPAPLTATPPRGLGTPQTSAQPMAWGAPRTSTTPPVAGAGAPPLWAIPPDADAPGAPYRPTAAALRQPYSNTKRVTYGLLWAGWTVVLTIAGFGLLSSGQILPGLIALALAGLAGRYDYRIWAWRARRLLFFIIF